MNVYKVPSVDFENVAVEFLVNSLKKLQGQKDKIAIALSGGSTPIPILKRLVEENLEWEKFHFFLVDERCVSLNDAQSNYGTIKQLFFDHIASHSYSMIKEGLSVDESIQAYEADMIREITYGNDGHPIFDLMLLGMGEDGHTASLFPGTLALEEKTKTVVKNFVPKLNMDRITLTYPTIINAKELVVMIKGDKKKQIFDQLHTQEGTDFPIQKIVDEYSDLKWIIETEQ